MARTRTWSPTTTKGPSTAGVHTRTSTRLEGHCRSGHRAEDAGLTCAQVAGEPLEHVGLEDKRRAPIHALQSGQQRSYTAPRDRTVLARSGQTCRSEWLQQFKNR